MVTTARATTRFFHPGSLICLILLAFLGVAGAQTAPAADADNKSAAEPASTSNQDSLRSYLQIQEQLHSLLSIEKNRDEADSLAASNSLVLQSRLKEMEIAVGSQRLDGLKDIEHSDHVILIAGAFALSVFAVLLIIATLQWTAVNRLVAATICLPSQDALQALAVSQAQMPSSPALEQSTTRFLSLVERLEQRIQSMELATQSPKALLETKSDTGEIKHLPDASPAKPMAAVKAAALLPTPAEDADSAASDENDPIALLIGKGQTLLKLDKPEEALNCLNEVLTIDPGNTEALLKKGVALERLQRLLEAIDCYDRVIAQDSTLTMAYLYKGAVYNRLERYGEALGCYEQALKTRQGGVAANVIFE